MMADKMFEICSNKRRPKREKRYRILKQRKSIRQQLKLLKKREYQKLRTMVPCIAGKPHVSKVTVIEEAVKYIDQLHAAVVMKLQARQIPAEVLSSPTREFFKATCSPVAKRTQVADEIFRLVRSSTEARRRRRQLENSNETRIRTERLHSAELSNRYLPVTHQGQQKRA